MKAAELFIRCLENEGVEYIFGVPGEENLEFIDALLESSITFVTTRHEQGAAFMADVYGRLTGKAGVCLSTLGPGSTNLITGVADANMDHAPVVAISGQGSTNRLHKESHQALDLEEMYRSITKYTSRLLTPNIITEVVRKAFKVAQTEKPGASFIEFPENISRMPIEDVPLDNTHCASPEASVARVDEAAKLINAAQRPIILAGNGVIRGAACEALSSFAENLGIPVANTFMAKGVIPFKHPMALGSAGLQSNDYVSCGFNAADVIICVGYDLVEYHPQLWHPTGDRTIIHVDSVHAEVDASYTVKVGVVGDIRSSLQALEKKVQPKNGPTLRALRSALIEEMNQLAEDTEFPVKPQKIIWDLRTAMGMDDIVICDVGAHKMWMARMFRCENPNTCIISNGFASMGIAIPGAIAAKMIYPERNIVAVTGDGGFMMNSQEIETAMRLQTPIVILIWNDGGYGLINWKQMSQFGRAAHVSFSNPDFVKYAESFGAKGYRVEAPQELSTILTKALADDTVSIIDCPVDYRENLKLTQKLGEMVCPV